MRNLIGAILGGLSGAVCIAAGLYLIGERSEAAVNAGAYDAAMTDVIAHAMGVYFIGKGFAVWAMTTLALRPKDPTLDRVPLRAPQ